MTDLDECACGARWLSEKVGMVSDHEYTHTRDVCSPHTVTLGNAADAERANRDAALIRFAREVLRNLHATTIWQMAVEHGLTDGENLKPGVLE